MPMPGFRHTLLWCLLLLLTSPSFGAIEFKTLSVNDGLSQSTVLALAQDPLGRIWMGTQDGLNCYDGYDFTAINWKKRTGPDGRVQEYVNQWHSAFTIPEKHAAQRFLAIFRITPDGGRTVRLKRLSDGSFRVGAWTVRAELDASRPPRLEVTDRHGNAVLYNTAESTIGGSTLIRQADAPQRELIDVVPASVR